MKKKILSLITILGVNIFAFAQYSSGALFPVGSTGVSVKLETTSTTVKLTLAGPSNSYLALGAGSNGMESGADGFIYNSASTTDYTFGGIGVTPSADAIQDWTILSNTISAGTRTIVATRSLSGSAGDTAIPNAAGNIDVFVARGSGTLIISNHGNFRDYATLPMSFDAALATKEDMRGAKPMIYPNPSNGEFKFSNASDIKEVHVFESSGKEVLSTLFEKNTTVNLKNQPSGTYYIEILMNNGEVKYDKIVKQ